MAKILFIHYSENKKIPEKTAFNFWTTAESTWFLMTEDSYLRHNMIETIEDYRQLYWQEIQEYLPLYKEGKNICLYNGCRYLQTLVQLAEVIKDNKKIIYIVYDNKAFAELVVRCCKYIAALV